MNCLDVRRNTLAAPHEISPETSAHLLECRDCRQFASQITDMDRQLTAALRVPAPECLQARVILRQSNRGRGWQPWVRSTAAIAACLVALAFIGQRVDQSSDERVRVEVSRVVRDRTAMPTMHPGMARDSVNTVLAPIGVQLRSDVGTIALAEPCVVTKGRSAHLVVAGEQGPVQVVIMPTVEVERTMQVTAGKLVGFIMPCPKGSIAILGLAGESLDVVRKRFDAAMDWI
jgi:hypothetical protein